MKNIKTLLVLILSTLIFLTMFGCGNQTPADLNADLALDNSTLSESESDSEINNCLTPDVLTFRAEVLASNAYDYDYWRSDALLLVYSITPVGVHSIGSRYFISQNDSIILLDMCGEPISHSDVPLGAIVEVTYYALVLESKPAVVPHAISVQIVDKPVV